LCFCDIEKLNLDSSFTNWIKQEREMEANFELSYLVSEVTDLD